jgi:hypothetical protein
VRSVWLDRGGEQRARGRTFPRDNDAATLFLEAVRAHANVAAGRHVIAGYDLAGEAACRLPRVFGGAILECCGTGPWRDLAAIAPADVAFFLFTRKSDPAREATLIMKDEMQRRGISAVYDELGGGREPMAREELDPAFAWLEARRAR